VVPGLSSRLETSKETSHKPSTDNRSQQDTLSAEGRWAEKMKPSRQRNMTQSQWDRLTRFLRLSRRERFQEAQSASIVSVAEQTDPSEA
jgi:hypothetical protein